MIDKNEKSSHQFLKWPNFFGKKLYNMFTDTVIMSYDDEFDKKAEFYRQILKTSKLQIV